LYGAVELWLGGTLASVRDMIWRWWWYHMCK